MISENLKHSSKNMKRYVTTLMMTYLTHNKMPTYLGVEQTESTATRGVWGPNARLPSKQLQPQRSVLHGPAPTATRAVIFFIDKIRPLHGQLKRGFKIVATPEI